MAGSKETASGITVTVEKIVERPSVAVLHCTGYIDTYNSVDFYKQVAGAMDAGARNLIFDMEKVNYISSTGVGTFPAFLKHLKPIGGNIIIAAMQPKVFEVIQLLGFSNFFTFADRVEEALEFFPIQTRSRAIPFKAMEAISDTFARLEGFVARENHPAFYAEIVRVLKNVADLQQVSRKSV